MLKSSLLALAWTMLLGLAYLPPAAAEVVIVGDGGRTVPILLAEGAPEETRIAVDTLVHALEKMTGQRLAVLTELPEPVPAGAIWVGMHPQLPELFPDVALTFEHPEEIVIAARGNHLAILGSDRTVQDVQVEFGTANAIYTFLQKHLGARRMAPWDREGIWFDVIESPKLTVPEQVYRFHPPFRQRQFAPSRPLDWDRFQRLRLDSLRYEGGHAFTDWWEKYHEAHPDWFAMDAQGNRVPPKWGGTPKPSAVKLCVSNPGVWAQWLDNAEASLRSDPQQTVVSASPNDGGGFCVCENCRAWDHPDGPVAGADRYVKFWNILARGLKERFPDRRVYVGAYAYSAYREPPIAEKLEDNIAIAYVGHFPLAGDITTQREKEAWLGWADKATMMVYRPNLFHYSGGFLGLPTVAMRRTIDDFRFLAENRCVGIQVDSLPNQFAVQGVQYYLMAQLAYEPLQDGHALLKDFYQRFFGPAAAEVEAYYTLMEQAHDAITGWEGFRHSSGWANEATEIFQQVYTPELMAQATELLATAAGKADRQEIRTRVRELQDGLAFAALQIEIMRVMKRVNESEGKDHEAVRKAVALCEQRDAMTQAGKGKMAKWYHKRVEKTLGPPSEAMQRAAGIGLDALD